MTFAVTTVQPLRRQVATTRRAIAGARDEAAAGRDGDRHKFGALVPAGPSPRRDDTGTGLDYGNGPFVAQLIGSRIADSPSRLEARLRAIPAAAAYRTAESLPFGASAGRYLQHSV